MRTVEQIKREAAVLYYRDGAISQDCAFKMYSLHHDVPIEEMTDENKQDALLNITLWLGTVPTVDSHGDIIIPSEGGQ